MNISQKCLDKVGYRCRVFFMAARKPSLSIQVVPLGEGKPVLSGSCGIGVRDGGRQAEEVEL